MKYAVTAATGQLGRTIIHALVERFGSSSVIAICRDPDKGQDLLCEKRTASYGDSQGLKNAFEGIDAVCMISLDGDPSKRIPLHRSVIDAARSADVSRVVFTSIMGGRTQGEALWQSVIKSNRDTEQILMASGLDYVVGRNGLYIEPDVEYVANYAAEGRVSNCAGDGRCSYTTRKELAQAYVQMMSSDEHRNQTYNLCGEPLTQKQLVSHLNEAFELDLVYMPVTEEAFLADRRQALGDLMGQIIAGIYVAIRYEDNIAPSHFEKAAGRPHQSWQNYFANLKQHRISGI